MVTLGTQTRCQRPDCLPSNICLALNGKGTREINRAVSFQPSPINSKQELVACHWHSVMTNLCHFAPSHVDDKWKHAKRWKENRKEEEEEQEEEAEEEE